MSRESLIELLRRAGVNRPVFYSVLTRGVQGFAALLGLLLVARVLDKATQGYYFAILGFVAFVQLAEFGLTYAVMQSASHEAAANDAARIPRRRAGFRHQRGAVETAEKPAE